MSDVDAPPTPGISPDRFIGAYEEGGNAPWDIGRPQPVFVELEAAGRIGGSVLDIGCGTGENALFLASRGHEVWGVDFIETAVAKARAKAAERAVAATFRAGDALELGALGRTFDAAIDAGCFHTFSDEQRVRFVESLAGALRPGGVYHLLCFSDLEERPGPRRLREDEIRAIFSPGFQVVELRRTRFESLLHEGGAHAWLARIERVA
jgi:cyclopropane fatty-acyl-phospholipid synthase-like methyltransferase